MRETIRQEKLEEMDQIKNDSSRSAGDTEAADAEEDD